MDIDFSVVIPACDETSGLERTLESVRNQDYGGNVELIVVDDNSRDDTGRIAGAYADLVLYCSELQSAPAARQYGAERSRGKNLVFLDADAEMSPNLLSEAARSLQAGYIGGGAPMRIRDDALGARCTEAVVNNWQRFVGPTFVPYLYCTRDVFQRCGGWDSTIPCAEMLRLQRRMLAHGKLAWDRSGRTTTDASRYHVGGYFLSLKAAWAQLELLAVREP